MTLAFGLGALLISVALSTSTWAFTRQTQLKQREGDQMNTAVRNARVVRGTLTGGSRPEKMRDFLAALPTGALSSVVREQVSTSPEPPTTSSNPAVGPFEDLPESLRSTVGAGSAAKMHFRADDVPYLGIGIPIPSVDAEYYEILDLAELEHSLERLAVYLTTATVLASAAGASVGWWASRRTLAPLREVSEAAEAIAGGFLDTRLEAEHDPDLAILVSSFNEMAQALQQRVERDARFASDVSHELRSPLMTLAASAEVLHTRREELPERSRSALDLLIEDVERFQELVSDLLEISRFDSGAADLQLEPVVLSEFLRQAVRHTSHRHVPVISSPNSDDLVVAIDKRRMAQVVANLLNNAARYANGASAVVVQYRPDEAEVDVIVEDEGPGVDPAEQTLIFERFARGKSAGARGSDGGSGLGLALVSEHVRLHGGRVRVENRMNTASNPAERDNEVKPAVDADVGSTLDTEAAVVTGARFVVVLPVREIAESDYPEGLDP